MTFTQDALIDFTSSVKRPADSADEPTVLTVHAAQPFPRGVKVSSLFADRLAGVAVKIGGSTWMTYVIPLHGREALFKRNRETGQVPL